MTLDPDPALGPPVVLHEQRLRVATSWQPTERLIVRRVITTQTRQIEVTVRREELRLERQPAHDLPTGQVKDATSVPRDPSDGPVLVIVLSQEEPVVHLRSRPYEQVSIHLDTVTEQQQVNMALSREQAEVHMADLEAEQPAR